LQVAVAQAEEVTRGVLIKPEENVVSTVAFIVGPITCVRKLNLPSDVVYPWLNFNQRRIRKAARKMLKMFPPSKNTTTMSLSLTEYFTETWRTIYIRSESPADPVVVGFKQGDTETSGIWTVINVPGSTSSITGGFASYPVRSYSISMMDINLWIGRDGMGRWKRRNRSSISISRSHLLDVQLL
jgi:hypothetical protein